MGIERINGIYQTRPQIFAPAIICAWHELYNNGETLIMRAGDYPASHSCCEPCLERVLGQMHQTKEAA